MSNVLINKRIYIYIEPAGTPHPGKARRLTVTGFNLLGGTGADPTAHTGTERITPGVLITHRGQRYNHVPHQADDPRPATLTDTSHHNGPAQTNPG